MRNRILGFPIAMVLLMATPVSASDQANFVMTNGKIYTVNAKQPWAEAVAIKGENIVYVGSNEGAHSFIGDKTKVTDLKGKVMLPGIVSAHEHPMLFMGISAGLFMENSGDKDLMLKTLEEYVKANPEGPYYSFGGAYEGAVEIYRQDIDKIISDKPFVMFASSGHGGWANTKALEMAGITKDQPDPIDHYARDKDGTPNGYLGSSAAVFYLVSKLGLVTAEAVMRQADDILGYISGQGITAMYDAGVPQLEESVIPVIAELEKQDRLTVRIVASIMAQRPVHIEAAIENMKKYGPMYSSELFNVNTLKVHGDGDVGGMTAGMLEPYNLRPDYRGLVSFPDPEQLSTFMIDAAKLGFDIHVHSMGDWACRHNLDGFEAVRKAGYKDARLSMGHIMFVDEQDRPRFAELDIIANNITADLAHYNPYGDVYFGKDRYATSWPMKSFLDRGVKLTLSADWPTEDLNPFLGIYTSIVRKRVGDTESLPKDSEKLTLEDAIKAYTIDGAYQIRMEKIIGSLEVGKRADLIIIDRDIFTIEKDEIVGTNVLITMMNGKIVHDEAVDPHDENPAKSYEDFDICYEDLQKE